MSSYAKYCRDQAAECARRVRLASSPEIAANCLTLELRWIKLAEKAEATDRRAGSAARASTSWSGACSALKRADHNQRLCQLGEHSGERNLQQDRHGAFWRRFRGSGMKTSNASLRKIDRDYPRSLPVQE
jgi:hypothetical protein